MDRREAISSVALLMGGALIGMDALLAGCTNSKEAGQLLSNSDIALLDEIGDTIIPTTNTPGAKAVKIGEFMALMVKDCYDEKHQKLFVDGIITFNKQVKEKTGKTFIDNNAAQRLAFLNSLDAEQKAYSKIPANNDNPHYFRMMKELTLLGYFTSEIGATQTLRYVETPGRFDGCVPYKKGDKLWA